jgi:hypothetical protein
MLLGRGLGSLFIRSAASFLRWGHHERRLNPTKGLRDVFADSAGNEWPPAQLGTLVVLHRDLHTSHFFDTA